jgi:phage terminase Nu1 subunit (DNA packaging protein)
MTQTPSKSRQQAEMAFARAQSQFLSRERASEEAESDARLRAEKTSRLREARLAKERADRENPVAAPTPAKPPEA